MLGPRNNCSISKYQCKQSVLYWEIVISNSTLFIDSTKTTDVSFGRLDSILICITRLLHDFRPEGAEEPESVDTEEQVKCHLEKLKHIFLGK